MVTLAGSSGDKRHALKVRADDLYETPPEATLALLREYWIPGVIWEPACGKGAIVRVLRAAGRQVWATDLVDYESRDQDESGWDFLMETQLPLGVEMIITNPPFKNAGNFVRKALDLCPRVSMLMRLAFLEGTSRTDVLENAGLARILVFRNRLPLMHRDGWGGAKSTNTIAFAWFIWEKDYGGATEVHRISWIKCGDPLAVESVEIDSGHDSRHK